MNPIFGETPIDPSCLLPGVAFDGTRESLNQLEIENIEVVVDKYLIDPISEVDAPFTYDWMLQLHREMFCNVWNWAGAVRNYNVTIGCDAAHVAARLWDLAECVPYFQPAPNEVIRLAAELHHRAVHIHPFPNGNGRWSRMLANVWLRLRGSPITFWPADMAAAGANRTEYINAVVAADARNLGPLVELHRRYTPLDPSNGG